MSAAAEKPSEYLKRTCLICGCNTNQTINIYEPRSGPNIVELIQAKFKFQPLNEDKYLCFSCNNWLINWHSLQANNSNDAESPSGTFRSAQVNGAGIAQEKRARSTTAQPTQRPLQQQSISSRPIAQVRPQQLLNAAEEAALEEQNSTKQQSSTNSRTISAKYVKYYYAKRNPTSSGLFRLKKSGLKQLNACCVCGRPIVLLIRQQQSSSSRSLKQISKPKHNAKCRKCRNVCQWRSIYMRSLKDLKPPKTTTSRRRPQKLVNNNINTTQEAQEAHQQYPPQPLNCLKRPLVDGKVVAMLRRLGTTLSRECSSASSSSNEKAQLPPIMSPAKPKPRWTRPLDDDEILLNFETAISEVLPIVGNVVVDSVKAAGVSKSRRKLTYHVPSQETEVGVEHQQLLSTLPRGLNVSLI